MAWLFRPFQWLWQGLSWLRGVLANLLLLLILIVVATVWLRGDGVPALPSEGALALTPSGVLVDQKSVQAPLGLLFEDSNTRDSETLVRDLVTAIDRARDDERINSLVIDLNYLVHGGISKLDEIGAAIERFKASGKPVIAYSDTYTQDQYYLASFADEVYLNPMGGVLLNGYGYYRNYVKRALDSLQVEVHIFRSGDYKDFLEPLVRNDMSPASKAHNQRWLGDLWSSYTSRVENLRNLPRGSLDGLINSIDQQLAGVNGDSAQLALQYGLVDGLFHRDQLQARLMDVAGRDGDRPALIERERYQAMHFEPPRAAKIGLLVASGTIVDGEQPRGTVGADTVLQLLRDARQDPRLKALVVRIDSGGGSALASEIIRRELALTREAGIPVLVSMGAVAASGGYWIATGADEIWAQPTTVTGSIGVFGAFPSFHASLDAIGINNDGVGTTELAGGVRPDRPLDPRAKRALQSTVDGIYDTFIERVMNARNLSREEMTRRAGGRIWSGATAFELGLVDQLGDLDAVLAAAAERAQLSEYQVRELAPPLSPFEAMVADFAGAAAGVLGPLPAQWAQFAPWAEALAPVLEPWQVLAEGAEQGGVFALCAGCRAP